MSSPTPTSQQTEAERYERELERVWRESAADIEDIDSATENWKSQALPLARIKKIMKSEEILYSEETEPDKPQARFMIAGEAPLLLGKACELLIRDLTTRAWRHTEKSKRRTLQKQDVHAAVADSDVYDFLIDIVPRIPPPGGDTTQPTSSTLTHAGTSNVERLRMEEGAALVTSSLPGVSHEAGLNLMNADLRLASVQQQQYMMFNNPAAASAAGGGTTVVPGVQSTPVGQVFMTHTPVTAVHTQNQPHTHSIPDSSVTQRESASGSSNR